MAVFVREDGAQFVLDAYRETLRERNVGLLKNEIRLLSQTNGQFAKVAKRRHKLTDVVLSPDPGYLFGETVWRHFARPPRLIFYERLQDNKNSYLVVIVKDGEIYLDACLTAAELREEIAVLKTQRKRYVIHGCDHLSDTQESITFDGAMVASLSEHQSSILQELPLSHEVRLLPIDKAITNARLHNTHWWLGMGVACVVAAVFLVWLPSSDRYHKKKVDPLRQYQLALTTPAPSAQLHHLQSVLERSLTMPGWTATSVRYTPLRVNLHVNSLGGNVASLTDWVDNHDAYLNLSSQGADVTIHADLPGRPLPVTIERSQRVVGRVIDRMMYVMPQKSVSIGAIVRHEGYSETHMSIMVDHLALSMLHILASALHDLPITLRLVSLQVREGMLIGKIDITVMGN